MSVLIDLICFLAVLATVITGLYGLIEYGNPLAVPLSYRQSSNRVVRLAVDLLRNGRDWKRDPYDDVATHPTGLKVRARYSWSVYLKFDGEDIALTSIDKLRLRRAWTSPRATHDDQAALLAARIIERYDRDNVVPMRRQA